MLLNCLKNTILLLNLEQSIKFIMFIRHLSSNPEQRKGEKQRLEKAYQDSDKNLNGLVQGMISLIVTMLLYYRIMLFNNIRYFTSNIF